MASGAIERGRLLFAQEAKFVAGAATFEVLPKSGLPEIAFVGRSNAGKSSLINALTGRKALARTSNTPGRTRQINVFRIGDRMTLADLPGYGFARVSKAESHAWNTLISSYLQNRRSLRRVMVLIDARRGPMESDLEAMTFLDRAGAPYQLVLTKTDAASAAEREAADAGARGVVAEHTAAHPEIMATASHTGEGIPELRAELAELISR